FVRIRDHGDGVPTDMQAAVFDKYMRLQKADQQNAGTGLGLTICQSIMRLLDGRIELDNHPDGGAVFTLYYPDKKRAYDGPAHEKSRPGRERLFYRPFLSSVRAPDQTGGLALRPVIMR
ncbi:MAG TPA: ATP-binding protein, partial [Asticcacaulis sp.]